MVTNGRFQEVFNWLRTSLPGTLRAYVLPFLAYGALVVAVTPPVVDWPIRLAFYGYAFLVFGIVWGYVRRFGMEPTDPHREARIIRTVAIAALVFLAVTRLLPFLRYGEAPLGYDTGFYLSSIDGSIHSILTGYGHRNFRALLWLPLEWLKIPTVAYLHGLYVLTQFLIAGALVAFCRTMRVSSPVAIAVAALALFAVSLPQFFAFFWMYYQTELAIAFLLLTLTFLHRRSWLAVVTGAFGVAVHPATFLPFISALVVYVIIQLVWSAIRGRALDREITVLLILGIVIVAIARYFEADVREFVLVYLRGSTKLYGWFYTNYPQHLQPQFTGLYVNRTIAQLADIYLLPFALSGLVLFGAGVLRSRVERFPSHFRFLLIWTAVLTTFVLLPVIYQNRFLIYLDLALIVFAAPAIIAFVRACRIDPARRWLLGILFLGFTLHAGSVVWAQEPQVFPDELREIKSIARVSESNAYAFAPISMYTPWLMAFSSRSTIDPGYLGHNQWTYEMWLEYWNGRSDARRHELLRMYDRPIYLFLGRGVRPGERHARFVRNDTHFTEVSAYVWRYDPRTISAEEVEAMREREEEDARAPR